MGADRPAVLFSEAVNFEEAPISRQENLSTGRYTLVDVACRACSRPLGWRYLEADKQDQYYKVGKLLLQQEALVRDPGLGAEEERRRREMGAGWRRMPGG
jgi:hypothetical protein